MYGKCAELDLAREAFDRIFQPNLYSATIMLDAYARNGHMLQAQRIFDAMEVRNVVAWTAMVSGYSRSGHLAQARCVFDRMPYRNVVTWNAILAAYSADSDLFAMECLYAFFNRSRDRNVATINTMISAYASRGRLIPARTLFEAMHHRDIVSWNAMIKGSAHSGEGLWALELFRAMELEGFRADETTMVGVLMACARAGLVEDARIYFAAMGEDRRLRRQEEHYCCMIDALGRSGRTGEAEELIDSMPFEPRGVAWSTLLAASRAHGDARRADRATRCLAKLESADSSPAVIDRIEEVPLPPKKL
ncbi:hypothetical protein SELMODRAFT_126135 [Selaginella moellendorffii]|uniref:Pentacotripeptide-repeat region of PRORP domain-containing protein n=1 Tax=Selaginella moellendorffii TaxID=88036 RepID=D8SVP5_SELML|nr:hypothetical protein SELMODRAFT_126135 [Selaginella moellendorffii]